MGAAPQDERSEETAGIRRWLPWIVGIASVAAVIFAAMHFSEARDFARLARHANGWWLFAALALQAATYLAQGQVTGCVGRAGKFPLSVKTLYRLSLAKLFVEQAVPSAGVSGTTVVVGALEREGMPRPLISTAVIVDLVSCWSAYALGLLVALVLVLVRHQASRLIVIVSVLFIVGMSVLSGMAITIAGRPAGRLAQKLKRFKPAAKIVQFVEDADPRLSRSRRLRAEAVGWQLAILLIDSATMWVLLKAVGAGANPVGVFASYMISAVFRTVESLPGGLGAFEGSSVYTLKLMGVSVAAALSATLLFRGLSFWLPMIPGMILSRRLTRKKRSGTTTVDQRGRRVEVRRLEGTAMISATDLRVLDEHHGALGRVLDDLQEEVRNGDRCQLGEPWALFEREVRDHMALEEESILPEYARAHPREAARIRDQHQRFRDLLVELGVETDLHCLRLDEITTLAAEFRAHAEREDETLYAWAAAHVATWPRIVEQIRERSEHLRRQGAAG